MQLLLVKDQDHMIDIRTGLHKDKEFLLNYKKSVSTFLTINKIEN